MSTPLDFPDVTAMESATTLLQQLEQLVSSSVPSTNSRQSCTLTTGSTPLHFAAANGHASIVQILLACGAVPDKPDKNGMTPQDLAELSNYGEVVRAIQVWTHLNGSQRSSAAAEGQIAGPSRPRADSIASNVTLGSDVSDTASSRKGKERASSVVSAASEKARLLRNSFGNGFRNRTAPMTNLNNSDSSVQLTKDGSDSGAPSSPVKTPELEVRLTPTTESENPTSDLPSPFAPSPTSPVPLQEQDIPPDDFHTPVDVHTPENLPTPDPSEPSPPLGPSPSYNQRSSRRPSLPSIFEKAAHPGATFRHAMRKTEQDSSPSITESEPMHHGMFRGRRNVEPTHNGRKTNKHAILSLFRRGHDTPSRSPSPPEPPEVARPPVPDQLEQGIARLKRASMDPEMMQMAMDVAQLGDQLEAAAAIAAPTARTRFFEDQVANSEQHSVLPNDRPWERRSRANSGVMSPSPLANVWAGEDSDDAQPRQASVRRTRTEVRRTSYRDAPRRMPSAPSLPDLVKRRSMTLPSQQSSPLARATVTPTESVASLEGSNADSPVPAQSEDSDDHDSSEPTPIADELRLLEHATPIRENGSDEPALSHDKTDGSEGLSISLDTPANSNTGHEIEVEPEIASSRGRFRGHSIGSTATDSSRGISTPALSQLMTPPASGTQSSFHEEGSDLPNLGMFPMPPEKRPSREPTGIGSGLPSGPSRASSRRSSMRPLNRKISSHAEAHEALKQDEADVLELAQMPASEDSSRSLADQLAAYGESHALAAEFARHERLSVSGSSQRTSTGSDLSAPSKRSSRSGHLDTSCKCICVTLLMSAPKLHLTSMDPSINKIYDRRAAAYRNQLQALTSAPTINGLKHPRDRATSMSSISSRHRATSGSDMWMNTRPSAQPTPRRLTDPSTSLPPMTPLVDNHPHISNPMPVVSDMGTHKPKSRVTVPSRALASSLKTASSFAPVPRSSVGSSHTSTPNTFSAPATPRYQGLAQARSYAAHQGILSDRYASRPGDGEESDDEDNRNYTMVENLQVPERRKWGGIKGAIGHFRR